MQGSTMLLVLLGVAGVGAGVYFYAKSKTATNGSDAAQPQKTQNAFDAFLAGAVGGIGKGVGDWYGSGYNSGDQSGPWADDTSWYGYGADEYQ